jgi:hypothetical protein
MNGVGPDLQGPFGAPSGLEQIAEFVPKCSNHLRREPGRSAMTRDQTTNFRNSAVAFFLGRIALAQLNFAFSRLRIKLDGFRAVDRNFTEDDFRLQPPGSCLQSPHLSRDEQGDD